jgi:hypothetical protein
MSDFNFYLEYKANKARILREMKEREKEAAKEFAPAMWAIAAALGLLFLIAVTGGFGR